MATWKVHGFFPNCWKNLRTWPPPQIIVTPFVRLSSWLKIVHFFLLTGWSDHHLQTWVVCAQYIRSLFSKDKRAIDRFLGWCPQCRHGYEALGREAKAYTESRSWSQSRSLNFLGVRKLLWKNSFWTGFWAHLCNCTVGSYASLSVWMSRKKKSD